MSKLKIFRNAFVNELRNEITKNMDFYKGIKPMEFLEEHMLQSNKVNIDEVAPTLGTNVADDIDNAIKIYEYLSLDETQASDARLWTYLTHVTFKDYVISRWPVSKENPETSILNRWFLLGGSARSLRRNAISRLWWAVHLTVAPWENTYFACLENSDRYTYTKALFLTEDIYQALAERRLGWSKPILIAILDYFKRNPDFAKNRVLSRNLIKEVNLLLGYRKIMALELKEIITEIEGIAEDLKQIPE